MDPRLDPRPKGSFAYLAAATLAAALGGLLFGFDTAVISGTEGFVKNQFGLSDVAEGWFVSSAILGCILGVIGAGKLSDAFGRKKVLFLSAILFFISAAGCAAAPWYTLLVGFRLVGGLGIGVASMLAPMYISELTPAHLRGASSRSTSSPSRSAWSRPMHPTRSSWDGISVPPLRTQARASTIGWSWKTSGAACSAWEPCRP